MLNGYLKFSEPVFLDERGTFTVTLYNDLAKNSVSESVYEGVDNTIGDLLLFLRIPRSRQEIAAHLGIGTVTYAMSTYINPLIANGSVQMTMPEKPKSPKQKFVAVK